MLSATKESDLLKSGEDSLTSQQRPMQRRSENPFGADNAQDGDKVATGRINNHNSTSTSSSSSLSEKNDSSQEIAEGNCLDGKGERFDGKIDTPKKRFFDLRRTAESASNKISSISPSRLAASLTPKLRRKSAANHKLSQLERASNLFIRDGSEANVNKQELTSAAMETRADVNAQHQQNSLEGNPGQPKCKKSSLMPSFGFKIPSASPQRNKNDGNLNKILCTNFAPATQSNLPPPPSDAFGNYEEIDIVVDEDEDVAGRRRDMITNAPDALDDGGRSNCTKASSETVDGTTARQRECDDEFNSIESCVGGEPLDMLSKPEFSSNMFKNIPVRPRKGQVAHMDNYCLFDPVDFEAQRKKILPTQFHLSSQNFLNFHVERQLVYDISEHDERQASLAHHNYYEIDPELLEKEESPPQPRKSTSSSSSCDYPLVETPSSTVTTDSPDEHDAASKLNIPTSNVAINHASVALEDDGNVITVSSVASATGAKKKSPQFDRIVKQVAPRNPTDNANQRQTTSGKSTRINLPFYNGTLSLDPLKSSHSLPQLQNITMRREESFAGDYNIEINNRTTIHLRRSVKKVRPMSSESLDSGFTTPSPPNEKLPARNPASGDNNRVDNLNSGANEPVKSESTVLTQCDNIQQLIEVSNETRTRVRLTTGTLN